MNIKCAAALTLALADVQHNLVGLAARLQRVGAHQLPVVEHALGEGLQGWKGGREQVSR